MLALQNLRLPLQELNAEQQQIVLHPGKQLCVLAGAGSGKTTVLTHRLHHLIKQTHIDPQSFLLLTFSNKAVCSLREKLAALGLQAPQHAVSTFHAFSFLLLKKYGHLIRFPSELHLINSAQQKRMLASGLLKQGIKANRSIVNRCLNLLHKDQQIGQTQISAVEQEAINYYRSELARQGLLDFEGLLSHANLLLRTHQPLLKKLHSQVQALFVDEFQDTNAQQYELIKQLITEKTYLFLVGDDDQAIYGWRGAHQAQFEQFLKQYPQAVLFKLEKNYRSHPKILTVANRLIHHNLNRIRKDLKPTVKDTGKGCVTLVATSNEHTEAEYICLQLIRLIQTGINPNECLVLYRTHQIAQVLEARLIAEGLGYCIAQRRAVLEHGVVRLLVQYLRFFVNPHLDVAFREILLQEVKGIGERRLEQLEKYAHAFQCSLWKASIDAVSKALLPPSVVQPLLRFLQQLEALDQEISELDLLGGVLHCVKSIGLDTEKEALEGFLLAAEQFQTMPTALAYSKRCKPLLTEFLNHLSLVDEALDIPRSDRTRIQLMTLHRAKGLEFSHVFIMAIEEGILPLCRIEEGVNQVNVEEERRLLYMGMTRAKTQLFLTYAMQRQKSFSNHAPSRFLAEIGTEGLTLQQYPLDNCFLRMHSNPTTKSSLDLSKLIGLSVKHRTYGKGVVVTYKQMGMRYLLAVEFENLKQRKWFSQSSELCQQLIP